MVPFSGKPSKFPLASKDRQPPFLEVYVQEAGD